MFDSMFEVTRWNSYSARTNRPLNSMKKISHSGGASRKVNGVPPISRAKAIARRHPAVRTSYGGLRRWTSTVCR